MDPIETAKKHRQDMAEMLVRHLTMFEEVNDEHIDFILKRLNQLQEKINNA